MKQDRHPTRLRIMVPADVVRDLERGRRVWRWAWFFCGLCALLVLLEVIEVLR
jgi:bacteriorhodopsin